VKGEVKKQKRFSLHWGSGVVAEEAQSETAFHRPTIQLLEFTEGEVAGSHAIRFCFYDKRGRFARDPLVLSEADLPALAEALKAAPVLREKLMGLLH
jgi:hypothetical protein